MIFTTNKSLKAWGGVLHDDDLAQAIIDRVLERGRLLRLDGPSVRTLHVNLDEAMKADSDQQADLIRISGNRCPDFPEPTVLSTAQRGPFARCGYAASALRGRPPRLPFSREARAWVVLRCAPTRAAGPTMSTVVRAVVE
jgi:hypothetical protein